MKFLTTNQVESFDSITVASGDASKAYIYDRNFATKWLSVGSDDTTTETIEIIFALAKTIDRISLINHNLKEFDIQYWNGSAYVDFSTAIDETTNTSTNDFYSFTSVSTLKIKLSATKTGVVDAQKYLSQLLAYAEHFDIPDNLMPDSEDLTLYYKEIEHELSDGGSLVVVEATKPKYRNVFSFSGLPLTYRNYLYTLKNTHQSFWLIPFDDTILDQYFCNMTDIKFNKVAVWNPADGERCYAGGIEVKET